MADGFFPRSFLVDGFEGEGDFDEFFTVGHSVNLPMNPLAVSLPIVLQDTVEGDVGRIPSL